MFVARAQPFFKYRCLITWNKYWAAQYFPQVMFCWNCSSFMVHLRAWFLHKSKLKVKNPLSNNHVWPVAFQHQARPLLPEQKDPVTRHRLRSNRLWSLRALLGHWHAEGMLHQWLEHQSVSENDGQENQRHDALQTFCKKRKQNDRVHLHDLVVPSPTFYDLAVPSPTFYDLVVPSPTQDILNLVDDYLVVSSGIWFFYDLMGPESKSEPWFVESPRVEPWQWGQGSSKLRTTCTCQWQSNPKGPTKVDNIENLIAIAHKEFAMNIPKDIEPLTNPSRDACKTQNNPN